MNKYELAQWIIKVIKSCKFTEQVRNCTNLIERHILTFRDPELHEIIISEWVRKMRSSMPSFTKYERQYILKFEFQ